MTTCALPTTLIRKTARRVEVHLLRGQFAAAVDVVAGLAEVARGDAFDGELDDILDRPFVTEEPVGHIRDLVTLTPEQLRAEVFRIIRKAPLASFNVLSTRILNKLERDFGVLTLEQLLELTPGDIKGARNFGPQQIGQIADFLESIQLEAKGLR